MSRVLAVAIFFLEKRGRDDNAFSHRTLGTQKEKKRHY